MIGKAVCIIFLTLDIFAASTNISIRGSKTDSDVNNRRLQDATAEVDAGFNIIKKSYGEGWSVWDKQTVIKGVSYTCNWTRYRVGNKMLPMCVHSEADLVSNSIIEYGFWGECNHIHKLWLASNNGNIFVDIGANIGSCVLHFLMHTDANIVAFEPNPRNLFCLTSTLSNLDYKYQRRVTLYPIGLGSKPSTSIIFGSKGNLGHSSISLDVNEKRDVGQFHAGEMIHVDRLDNILDSGALSAHGGIRVMKIDVEGFECYVFDGIGEGILRHVHKIHTEVSANDLKQNGCSSEEYLQKFQDANFQTTLITGEGAQMQTYTATNRFD